MDGDNICEGVMIKSIYLIGSLKNKEVLEVTKILRELGLDVFSDWLCPGPDADDYLRDYYRELGLNYREIMSSYAAKHIYEFDRHHLDRCDAAILVMPGGKSAHLELGYTIGKGKPGFILFDQEPERVDIMHQFATEIFMSKEDMVGYFSQ